MYVNDMDDRMNSKLQLFHSIQTTIYSILLCSYASFGEDHISLYDNRMCTNV